MITTKLDKSLLKLAVDRQPTPVPVGQAPKQVGGFGSRSMKLLAPEIKTIATSLAELKSLVLDFKKKSLENLDAYLKTSAAKGKSIDEIAHVVVGFKGAEFQEATAIRDAIFDKLKLISQKMSDIAVKRAIAAENPDLASTIDGQLAQIGNEVGLLGDNNSRNSLIGELLNPGVSESDKETQYSDAVKRLGPSLGVHTVANSFNLYSPIKEVLNNVGAKIKEVVPSARLEYGAFSAWIDSEGLMHTSSPEKRDSSISSKAVNEVMSGLIRSVSRLGIAGSHGRIMDALGTIMSSQSALVDMKKAVLVAMVDDFMIKFNGNFQNVKPASLQSILSFIDDSYEETAMAPLFKAMVTSSGKFGEENNIPYGQVFMIKSAPAGTTNAADKKTDGTISLDNSGMVNISVNGKSYSGEPNVIKKTISLDYLLKVMNKKKVDFNQEIITSQPAILQGLYYEAKKIMLQMELSSREDVRKDMTKSSLYKTLFFDRIYRDIQSNGARISSRSRDIGLKIIVAATSHNQSQIEVAKARKQKLEAKLQRLKKLDQADADVVAEIQQHEKEITKLNNDMAKWEDVEKRVQSRPSLEVPVEDIEGPIGIRENMEESEDEVVDIKKLKTKEQKEAEDKNKLMEVIESGIVTIPAELYEKYVQIIKLNSLRIKDLQLVIKKINLMESPDASALADAEASIAEITKENQRMKDKVAGLASSDEKPSEVRMKDTAEQMFETPMEKAEHYLMISRKRVNLVPNARKNLKSHPLLEKYVEEFYPEFIQLLRAAEDKLIESGQGAAE